MSGPGVWNPAGGAPLPPGSSGREPPILHVGEVTRWSVSLGSRWQVAGRASSAWGRVGTRWQVSLMGLLRAILSCFLLVCSTLRL